MAYRKILGILTLVYCGIAESASAQPEVFAGTVAGIATLSADSRASISPNEVAVSLYTPGNGPALSLFLGLHLTDYVSVQGNFIWNRNSLSLTSAVASETDTFYEQRRGSTQQALIADLLVYFRQRQSRVRPYLSVGTGVVRFSSRAQQTVATRGSPTLPAPASRSNKPALRVAVGIDLGWGGGWAVRYSFSETIRANDVSAYLTPPGRRNLANFQNLFGFVKRF